MKMEFGEDAENTEPVEETGLAARLSKKTKTQAAEKGRNDCSGYRLEIISTMITHLCLLV